MFFKNSFQVVFGALIVVMISAQIISQQINNFMVILLIIGTALLCYNWVNKFKITHQLTFQKVLLGGLIALNLVLLLYIALKFQINDVSDPLNVQIKATELMHGNYNWHTVLNGSEEYFYFYPNVVFYTIILSKIMKLGLLLGTSISFILHIMNFVLLGTVTMFSLLTSWRLNKKMKSLIITALVLLLYPVMYLYPNIVTYTDTMTMALTTFVFFLIAIILTSEKFAIKLSVGVILTLTFAVLYAVKPNMIILLPAAIILIVIVSALRMNKLGQTIMISVALAVGCGISTIATTPILQHYGFNQQDAKKMALPVTHWINMGLNPEGMNGPGAYDEHDDDNARKSKIDNQAYLITNSIKYRVKALGFGGLWKLVLDKAQTLLGTPLFGFGKYFTGWADAPRFYLRHQAMLNELFSIIATTVLIMCIGNLFIKIVNLGNDNHINNAQMAFVYLVGIAAIGLTIFHTLVWEVEPRYFLPLLYPLLLLTSMDFKSTSYKAPINYDRTAVKIGVPIAMAAILVLTLSSARNAVSVAFGNMEHPVRVAISNKIPVKSDLVFNLPVKQDIDVLKVNLQPQAGMNVYLADGTKLIPQNDQYVIERHCTGGHSVQVKIKIAVGKVKQITLYRRIDLYKKLFHGSSITYKGDKYYLPYEMDIYDRTPFKTFITN